jgi:hypothetical protein
LYKKEGEGHENFDAKILCGRCFHTASAHVVEGVDVVVVIGFWRWATTDVRIGVLDPNMEPSSGYNNSNKSFSSSPLS